MKSVAGFEKKQKPRRPGVARCPLKSSSAVNLKSFKNEIEEWYASEQQDWDAAVQEGDTESQSTSGGLWDLMPTIDSKAVARTSPIFERHFGKPLDVKTIKAGGYNSTTEMLDHLIPQALKSMNN